MISKVFEIVVHGLSLFEVLKKKKSDRFGLRIGSKEDFCSECVKFWTRFSRLKLMMMNLMSRAYFLNADPFW